MTKTIEPQSLPIQISEILRRLKNVEAKADKTFESVFFIGDTITSDATPDPTGDKKNNTLYITALTEAALFSAPSGTPGNGNRLLIRILDDGSGENLTWNAIYRQLDTALPATTTANKTLYLEFIYNSTSSTWDLLIANEQA